MELCGHVISGNRAASAGTAGQKCQWRAGHKGDHHSRNREHYGHVRSPRACEWCGRDFRPSNGVNPGHSDYQRGCSYGHGIAIRRFEAACPLSCPLPARHAARKRKLGHDPATHWGRNSPRRGTPVVRFCNHGCGRADVMPARQGPWTCEDCKTLYRRAERARRREAEDRISFLLRDAVLTRDNWTCQLCGEVISRNQTDTCADTYPNIDHVIPRALGGATEIGNLQASHRICNMRKGANYSDFRSH